MGYETEAFLVDQGYGDIFSEWEGKDEWCHADSQWRDLPDDALVSTGGIVIASVKLCKIGYDGPLANFFQANRKRQKAEKKYVALRWFWDGPDCEDEWVELTDSYGDPLTIHDAKDTLKALDESIAENEKEDYAYRRFTMFRAILVPFIETFPNAVVITRGY